jgi:hypothetical protein
MNEIPFYAAAKPPANKVPPMTRLAKSHAGNLDEQVRERSFANLGCSGSSFLPSCSTFQLPSYDLRFGVGIHETTFRWNVRWVTPLGEETASMS